MNDLSAFTLLAAAIALAINLVKMIPAAKTLLASRERAVAMGLGVLAAFLGRQFGWIEIAQEGFMGLLTTGAALSMASGMAYEQILKMFGAGPSTRARVENLERQTQTVPPSK